MGEDLHHKTYGKLKLTGKYIDLSSFEMSNGDAYLFPTLVDGRCYALFSLLGSHRDTWRELSCLEPGFPADVVEDCSWLKDWLDCRNDYNWYSFSYAKRSNLIECLKMYAKTLESPDLYYTESDDADILLDIKQSSRSILVWQEEADFIKKAVLEEWIPKLNRFREFDILCGNNIDIDSIVDVFWFDC